MKRILFITAFVLWLQPVFADQPDPRKQPDPDEFMKEMIRLASPGPEHKNLEVFVGTWDMTTKVWLEPGKDPVVSKGECARKSILEGRFVEEQVQGEMFGKKFLGMGVMGYDNAMKKYTSVWLDNMSTSVLISVGTYDAAKKTFTFENQEQDPATKAVVTVKTVIRVVDKDQYVLEMVRPSPDGKEWKNFELTAKRKKR